jgi:hypothetical protein
MISGRKNPEEIRNKVNSLREAIHQIVISSNDKKEVRKVHKESRVVSRAAEMRRRELNKKREKGRTEKRSLQTDRNQ